jgi:hypothetical protein
VIPQEHVEDPVRSLVMGLPLDLEFRTKGQLAIDICADAYTDGLRFDFACGDEVYGGCTQLREFFESSGQAYVLRVASNVTVTLATGAKLTCAEAVKWLVKDKRRWEVRSAGKGSKGERWYAWAWIATASPRHHLLVRRHLKTSELAFHYCYVPEGQLLTKTRLIRAAGLRWPVEEDFESARTASGWTGARPGSTPRSPATSCWSWPRWRSARSPPHCCATARIPRPRPLSPLTSTVGGPRDDPADRTGDQAPARRLQAPAPARPRRTLAELAAPPPGPLPLVPPAYPAKPRQCPGQLANELLP